MDDPKALVEYSGSNLPVTRADFDALSEQRKMLLEFVAKQLRKDVDYGVIPGTPKSSLFKPGGEKLMRLFGLGSRLTMTDKTIDPSQNFAMFTYKAEIVHLKSGQVISECEASCNSQEKKYKERTSWVWDPKQNKKVGVKEATPMYDVMNTLQKMAQKRAFVGGVILAVGASDFFTQDIDDVDDAANIGAAPRDVTASSVPNVTKVSSDAHMRHDGPSFMVQALTSMEERQLAKDAGFRWNAATKMWTKSVTEEEIATFPFKVQRIA